MNTKLFEFYQGKGLDDQGRSIDQILGWDPVKFDQIHDFIQWLFPLQEPSAFNKNAPLLDSETVAAITNDISATCNIARSFLKFQNFMREYNWVTPNNHNFLRISRVIKSLVLLDRAVMAQHIFDLAKIQYEAFSEIISDKVFNYWVEALSPKIKFIN